MPTAIPRRNLTKNDIRVSELGFGTWGIGGNHGGAMGYGPTNDAESAEALLAAFENGITFFDTSDLYGYGHSESLLGQTFSSVRQNIVIASKFGFKDFSGNQDFSIEAMSLALEASLKRLDTDYLDLYQLHSPTPDILKTSEPLLEALLSLKEQGVIRAIGISLNSPTDTQYLSPISDRIDVIQTNLSLVDQRIVENGDLDWLQNQNIGVIARSPLCYGFLTGEVHHSTFHKDDNRSRWSPEQRSLWSEATDKFRAEFPPQTSPTAMALNFCLSHPVISSVIPSMLNISQVLDNVKAVCGGPRLGEKGRARLLQLYQSQSFVAGIDRK